MKKLFKAILYFFIGILGLIVILLIFLFVYYAVLEKEQRQLSKVLEDRTMVTKIQESPASVYPRKKVLNLIPMPETVRFTGGIFLFPEIISFNVADSLKECKWQII